MSGLVSYINQLSESLGPGIMYCRSCPSLDVFFVGAITTSLFIFLHVAWNLLAFDGWFRLKAASSATSSDAAGGTGGVRPVAVQMDVKSAGIAKPWVWRTAWIVLTHAGASFGTLLIPSSIQGGCFISIAINIFILISTSAIVVWPV
ncbi:hypothetical protein HK102_005953, partial [Quaeritorhiza haematococci]